MKLVLNSRTEDRRAFRVATRPHVAGLRHFRWCVMLLVCCCATNLGAQESLLIPVNGLPRPANLKSVNDGRLNFITQDAEGEIIQYDDRDLVRWGHLKSSRIEQQVFLTDGSILIGRLARVRRDAFDLDTEFYGELTLPRACVLGVVWSMPMGLVEQWRFRNWPRNEERFEMLRLRNGDTIQGQLLAGDKNALEFLPEGGRINVKLDLVQSWHRASTVGSDTDRHQRTVVGLRDGTKLVSQELQIDKTMQVELQCGVRLSSLPGVRPIDEGLVCYLRFDQPRIRYLSDIEPLGYKHVPYLSCDWHWGRDRNTLQGPLSSGSSEFYAKGIGMHSTSRLAFAWSGPYKEFQSEICMDSTSGREGSVTFRVFTYKASEKTWSEAYKSPVVRGGDKPRPVRLKLAGSTETQRLALVVDYADRGNVLDRANWLGARLVKD